MSSAGAHLFSALFQQARNTAVLIRIQYNVLFFQGRVDKDAFELALGFELVHFHRQCLIIQSLGLLPRTIYLKNIRSTLIFTRFCCRCCSFFEDIEEQGIFHSAVNFHINFSI